MIQINGSSRVIGKYLFIGFQNWARYYFDGHRYSIMTISNDECLNAKLRDHPHLPIHKLIDQILRTL